MIYFNNTTGTHCIQIKENFCQIQDIIVGNSVNYNGFISAFNFYLCNCCACVNCIVKSSVNIHPTGQGSGFQVWDSNANSAALYLREIWKSNVRDTNLVKKDDRSETGYSLNNDAVEEILDSYSTLEPSSNNESIKNWISNFGIILSDSLLNYLRENEVPIHTSETKRNSNSLKWEQQFKSGGIFYNLYEKLNKNVEFF